MIAPGSEPERIDVVCPMCSAGLSVRRAFAGQHVRCKKCEHMFLVKKIEELPAQIGQPSSEADLFDRLYGEMEQPRTADPEPPQVEQRSESAGDLAAVAEENERLSARLESLTQDLAGIQAERDSLLVQLEQFRGEHDRLQSEQEQDRQEAQRLGAELASIRDALGGLSPGEIAVMRNERDSLDSESQRLRDHVQSLQAELSSGEEFARIAADREEETRLARLQADQLSQLRERLGDLEARLSTTLAQRDQLNEQIAHQDQALEAAHARSEELAEQLRQRDHELAAKLGELEQLAALRQADAAEAEELRGTLARREQEFRQESEEQRGQIDDLRHSLVNAEQAHRDERSRMDEQLNQAREQHESGRTEIAVLQARLSELLDLQEQLKADHLEAIEAQRSRQADEFQSALEVEQSQHTERIAELQARAEANAQLAERLKAEILTFAQARSAPDADLEAAHEEIADLRKKLADKETTKRSMSSLLEGMGIRLH